MTAATAAPVDASTVPATTALSVRQASTSTMAAKKASSDSSSATVVLPAARSP